MPHIKSVLAGFKVVYFMESSKVRKAASKEETFGASCFFSRQSCECCAGQIYVLLFICAQLEISLQVCSAVDRNPT